jgi:hypothetical protein
MGGKGMSATITGSAPIRLRNSRLKEVTRSQWTRALRQFYATNTADLARR